MLPIVLFFFIQYFVVNNVIGTDEDVRQMRAQTHQKYMKERGHQMIEMMAKTYLKQLFIKKFDEEEKNQIIQKLEEIYADVNKKYEEEQSHMMIKTFLKQLFIKKIEEEQENQMIGMVVKTYLTKLFVRIPAINIVNGNDNVIDKQTNYPSVTKFMNEHRNVYNNYLDPYLSWKERSCLGITSLNHFKLCKFHENPGWCKKNQILFIAEIKKYWSEPFFKEGQVQNAPKEFFISVSNLDFNFPFPYEIELSSIMDGTVLFEHRGRQVKKLGNSLQFTIEREIKIQNPESGKGIRRSRSYREYIRKKITKEFSLNVRILIIPWDLSRWFLHSKVRSGIYLFGTNDELPIYLNQLVYETKYNVRFQGREEHLKLKFLSLPSISNQFKNGFISFQDYYENCYCNTKIL